jgi:hypothetical protein
MQGIFFNALAVGSETFSSQFVIVKNSAVWYDGGGGVSLFDCQSR